jgi:hypothetical protein
VNSLATLAAVPPSALELADAIKNKVIEKFDPFLGDELLDLACARDRLDTTGLPALASELLRSLQRS